MHDPCAEYAALLRQGPEVVGPRRYEAESRRLQSEVARYVRSGGLRSLPVVLPAERSGRWARAAPLVTCAALLLVGAAQYRLAAQHAACVEQLRDAVESLRQQWPGGPAEPATSRPAART